MSIVFWSACGHLHTPSYAQIHDAYVTQPLHLFGEVKLADGLTVTIPVRYLTVSIQGPSRSD